MEINPLMVHREYMTNVSTGGASRQREMTYFAIDNDNPDCRNVNMEKNKVGKTKGGSFSFSGMNAKDSVHNPL